MSERVVLYRVRRPDGTVIEAERHSGSVAAISAASVNDELLLDVLQGIGPYIDLAEAAGYTIEPVVYAEMPSEETRKAIHSALIQLDYDAQRNPLSRQFNPAAALSELEKIWGQ